jgi:hypothetical protein
MIAGSTLLAAVPAARADFTLVSQGLTIDEKDHLADFSLTFNQKPNFTYVDSDGRPTDSFQYSFDGNFNPAVDGPYGQPTAIIRGDEIHLDNTIVIRNPNGDGGPNSGGWGPVMASVPFKLIGDTVDFAVPTADLGITDHSYQYQVYSLSSGSLTADQTVSVIPLPSAFYSGLLGLGLAAGAGMWMRRRVVRI